MSKANCWSYTMGGESATAASPGVMSNRPGDRVGSGESENGRSDTTYISLR